MADGIHLLTARAVGAITEAGQYLDRGGLNVRVAAGGTRQWACRYTRGGRAKWMGLGGFPAASITVARERASEKSKSPPANHYIGSELTAAGSNSAL